MDYSIQKVPKVIGRDRVTKEPIITLRRLKDLTFSNGSETTALTQDGVPLVHFQYGKGFKMSGSNATIDDMLMSFQLGTTTEVITTSTEIKISEIATAIVADQITLEYTPTGTAGSEVLWAELLDANGQTISKFQQAGTVATDKFTSALKVLTFNVGELAIGSRIRVSYKPTASTARKISNIADNYVRSLEWDIHCRFLDVCAKTEVLGYINIPSGYLSGAFEWATSEGGAPSTHAFEITAEAGCLDNILDNTFFYKEDDLS